MRHNIHMPLLYVAIIQHYSIPKRNILNIELKYFLKCPDSSLKQVFFPIKLQIFPNNLFRFIKIRTFFLRNAKLVLTYVTGLSMLHSAEKLENTGCDLNEDDILRGSIVDLKASRFISNCTAKSALGSVSSIGRFSDISLSNCGNLLSFSQEASKYQNKRSKMQLDADAMYALVADALCEVLLPKNHAPSHLEVENRKLIVRNNYDLERVGRGFRVEGRLYEILEICDNHHACKPTSLLHYIQSMSKMLTYHVVFEISSSLIRIYRPNVPETAAELRSNTSLRMAYAAMVSAAIKKEKHPDDDRNSAVLLFIMHNETLHNAILQKDYDTFLKEIHIATIKDSMETNNILASAILVMLPTIRIVYNALITCMLSLASGDLEKHTKQKQYLLNTATACINYLLPYSTRLSETIAKLPHHVESGTERTATIQDVLALLKIMKGDIENFASLIEIPKIPYSSPVIYNSDYGLEKIAAALLVLYPGVSINGNQILLHDGKPYLINLGTNKMDAEHPCFARTAGEKYSSQEEAIVSDIRSIFASIQELVPHMDWDIFINELQTICANLRNEKFAADAQQHILAKLKSNLPHSTLFDKKLPIVAYESILPRVNDILSFLANEHLVEATQRYTKLVYGLRTNVFSTEDFLEISGYKKTAKGRTANEGKTESRRLFAAIDSGYKCFEASISVPERRYTPVHAAVTAIEGRSPAYKISDLCLKKRQKLIKTLSRRSPHYVLLRELHYIVLPMVIMCATGIAYFFLTPPMPLKTIFAAVGLSITLFVATLIHKRIAHKKRYLMSIGQELRDTNIQHKYFPDTEKVTNLSNDNTATCFIERQKHSRASGSSSQASTSSQESSESTTTTYYTDASIVVSPVVQKAAAKIAPCCTESRIENCISLTSDLVEISTEPENCAVLSR